MELAYTGYNALAPLGSMLASALGISELEFAHVKDKGKEYEQKLIDSILPNGEGKESFSRIRGIFDKYELDTFMSFGKKKSNQKLANEMYIECLNLMKKRIEVERANGKDQTNSNASEKYKKRQMFLLKKLNYNFRKASKTEGFRFSMSPIVHDIGFCTDKLPKSDTLEIASEFVENADFGFDNKDLGKYSKAVISNNSRQQEFNKSLQEQAINPLHGQSQMDQDHKTAVSPATGKTDEDHKFEDYE